MKSLIYLLDEDNSKVPPFFCFDVHLLPIMSSGNKREKASSAAASKHEEKISSSGASNLPAAPEAQVTALRRSERKRSSAVPTAVLTTPRQTARRSTKKRPKTTPLAATTTELDLIDPNEWTIFGRAHQMVKELVYDEGPYRKKLLELAQHSIDNSCKEVKGPEKFTATNVVDLAWQRVCYAWANASSDPNIANDGACAYTSMGTANDGKPNFAVIAISSSFKENDYKQSDRPAALTTDDKKTLLLFFRKIKHEFLHVVHRYLAITRENVFKQVCTPEKYTPFKQSSSRRKPAPKVGDHDEEEDSGGPILPLKFNQKLSTENPLCLYLNGGYLQLTDKIVEGLLRLEIYSLPVDEGPHPGGFFGINDCRAVKRGVFDSDFYRGNPIASDYSRGSSKLSSASSSRASSASNSRASSPSSLRSSLPAEGNETDDDTDDSCELPYWRRYGHIPIQFPSNPIY